jgi:hypothetical protein
MMRMSFLASRCVLELVELRGGVEDAPAHVWEWVGRRSAARASA